MECFLEDLGSRSLVYIIERRFMTIPELKVKSTQDPDNKFKHHFHLKVNSQGMLEILPKKRRRFAHYKCWVEIQYISYEREVEIKGDATYLDERKGYHLTDYDRLTELRVQRCLVSWNLHEIPDFTKAIMRVNGILVDESLEAWKRLPPNLRKYIALQINEAMGG
jgi:hypothetical protein